MWAVLLVVGLAVQAGLVLTVASPKAQAVNVEARSSSLTESQLPPLKTRCLIPPPVGRCVQPLGGYFYNYDTGHCQHYNMKCGGLNLNENYFTTKLSCEAECQQTGSAILCSSQILQLQCNNPVGMFHFNGAVGRCEYNPFGGCSDNFNSFETLDQCNLMCKADQLSGVCRQRKDRGTCIGLNGRYHFDYQKRKCKFFLYGGCEGNANNFNTIEECERTCLTREQKCSQPLAKGTCKETEKRWYFKKKTGNCVKFTYKGCKGNQNNFISKEHCQAACLPVMAGGL